MRVAYQRSPGHPDQTCDIVADTIVDEYLRRDPATRVRIHVMGGKGALFISGMVSSKADFDVGALASRTAGMLGARAPVEPFVAIESIGTTGLSQTMRQSGVVDVMGYATRETPERIPAPTVIAKRVAKQLEALRTGHAEWFWLDAAFQVDVTQSSSESFGITMTCAHGNKPLAEVREQLIDAVRPIAANALVRVNPMGPLAEWSIDHDSGSSGTNNASYGGSLPSQQSLIGVDPYHPRKYGTWLARGLARKALERCGANAILVRAVYDPGERVPAWFSVKDERGKDFAADGDKELLRDIALASALRHGLNADAARWGYAGEAGMPWEEPETS
jgi:S-adenosylmethionine synthetase